MSACGSKADLLIGRNIGATPPQAGAATGGGDVGGGAGKPAAEAGSGGEAGAAPPLDCAEDAGTPNAALLHRYSFDGTGWLAKDSVGTADGELLNVVGSGPSTDAGTGALLDGNGHLVLSGNGYVDLPNHLISPLTEVSIVAWVQWTGNIAFERIFDFGVGVGEDNSTGAGKSYLALTPTGLTGTRLQILTKGENTGEQKIISNVQLRGQMHQVAVVFVSSSYTELYSDGVQVGRTNVAYALSDISDLNDWIGRSQWRDNHTFEGTYDELRIYGRALTPCQVAAQNAAGPDAL